MSNWIQENKSSAIVGGLGIVLFAGLFGAGIYASSQESDVYSALESNKSTIQMHGDSNMPPTPEVMKEVKDQLVDYQAGMDDISDFFAPFREMSVLGVPDGQTFQNSLKTERDAWLAYCKKKGVDVKNEASWMGFDAYRASAPQASSAPLLSFQKQGMEYFMTELVNSGATTIASVYRELLPSEQTIEKPKDKQNSRRLSKVTKGFDLLPFEVSFIGDRQSVVALLNTIIGSEKYFFTINAIRVRNEKQTLPAIASVAKAPIPKTTSIGLAVNSPTPKKENDLPRAAEEILKPVIGQEKIQVHIAVNLVFFHQADQKMKPAK